MKNRRDDSSDMDDFNKEEPGRNSKQIRKECLRLLTRRDHSRQELQDKLTFKGYDRNRVSETVDELSLQSWQSDSRYAENYARMRSQKGFGPVRIAFELRQQGIDPSEIENAMRKATDDWQSLLEQVYLKKFSSAASFDRNERAKRIRFLLQRGFSNSMINTFLKPQSE